MNGDVQLRTLDYGASPFDNCMPSASKNAPELLGGTVYGQARLVFGTIGASCGLLAGVAFSRRNLIVTAVHERQPCRAAFYGKLLARVCGRAAESFGAQPRTMKKKARPQLATASLF